MDEILHDLKYALEEEEKAYAQLLALSERQQSALIERRTAELLEVATLQEKMLLEVSRLDIAGADALDRAAQQAGLSGSVSLTDLTDHLTPQQAKPLQEVRASLHSIVHQLRKTNRVNKELLESGLDTVGFTFRLLAKSAQDEDPCYSQQALSSSSASLRFDLRV
jgi:hypothetical protein